MTSTTPKLTAPTVIPAIGLVLGNSAFLFLYFFYDLTLYQLVIVYWWECLWIGLFSALKLVTASIAGDPYENRYADVSRGANIFLSVTAIFFLGGTFLSLVFGLGLAIVIIPNWLAGVDILDLFVDNAKALFLAGIVLTIGHGLSFVINFIVMGEFRVAGAGQLIGWPFIRCFALLAAIGVAFVVAAAIPQLATTSGFAAILIIMKLLLDYRLHLAERKAIDRRRQAEV